MRFLWKTGAGRTFKEVSIMAVFSGLEDMDELEARKKKLEEK